MVAAKFHVDLGTRRCEQTSISYHNLCNCTCVVPTLISAAGLATPGVNTFADFLWLPSFLKKHVGLCASLQLLLFSSLMRVYGVGISMVTFRHFIMIPVIVTLLLFLFFFFCIFVPESSALLRHVTSTSSSTSHVHLYGQSFVGMQYLPGRRSMDGNPVGQRSFTWQTRQTCSWLAPSTAFV